MNRLIFCFRCCCRWEAIRQNEPALILMDISLGTTEGREICKDLKRKEATRNIPVILFSANI